MLRQKIKLFLTPFCETTPACMLVMVQGNIWVATLGHLKTAAETGFLTGAGVIILSLFTERWFDNKYAVAAVIGSMSFIADLLVHPSHFGSFTTEAIVTGAITAMISLTVNFLAKKLFAHGKARLSKGS